MHKRLTVNDYFDEVTSMAYRPPLCCSSAKALGMVEGLYITYSDYHYMGQHTQVIASLVNSGDFSRYHEEDMEKAKAIEAAVSSRKAQGRASLYMFVKDTDFSDRKRVNFQIVQIQMPDSQGKPLATFRAGI